MDYREKSHARGHRFGRAANETWKPTYGGTVDVMSTATLTVTGHIPLPDTWGYDLAVTPDNAYVEVLDAGDIEAISTTTQQLVVDARLV